MESMGGHLQGVHQEKFLENSFSTLLSWSAVQKMGVKSCPLCSSSGIEDSPELVNHILQHTYEFALRSLPWPQPIIHNLNLPPGDFDPAVNSSYAEELLLENMEDIQIYNTEDGLRLTAENLQRLNVGGTHHWTAEGLQLWINKEVHERKEPPDLQLTDYDRADHAATESTEFLEYSNYFLTNQYFGYGSDEDKSSKPQHGRSTGSITASTGTNRSAWNELESLEMRIMTAVANEVDGEERLQVLLKGHEGHITVTKDIVKAAAGNEICGKQVMRLLIIQPVNNVTIKADAVASIAETFDEEMMALLLKKRGDHIIVTVDIVKAAARNLKNDDQVMELLLEHQAKLRSIHMEDAPFPSLDKKQIGNPGNRSNPSPSKPPGLPDTFTNQTLLRRVSQSEEEKPDRNSRKYSPSTLSSQKPSQDASRNRIGLGSLELDAIEPYYVKSGDDWYVIFNPQVQRTLDVDAVHTLFHDSAVCSVQFSPDGRYVATGSLRFARIFDVYTGEEICTLECETINISVDNYVRSVCFSPNGKYLATGSDDTIVRVWDIATKTLHKRFLGHERGVYICHFAHDGRTIISGSLDKTVRLWDINTGVNTLTLTAERGITTVALSPDSQYIAAGGYDQTIYLWEAMSGRLVEYLKDPDGHTDAIFSMAFLSNGKGLVSGSLDRTIKIWELRSPRGEPNSGKEGSKCVGTLQGHNDFVLSVALSPDSLWVISGSEDRSAQFWDSRTGEAQFMVQGHTNAVISVASSPRGGYFATSGRDKTARIWAYYPYGVNS
ncbi:uncharacterized protein Triagg1_1500 [Trichoderma aggressivum f. europaeum]|uniref:WD40 repeat-like protein n=1 Tax=Trichoderma aggressivum f. europaeum TaxID=173218 RepID=A0AAE1JDY0_9HYPO|nr:hypothetical protein Triagg1_1500 [Trichoderma aggressivum f. europaeum]